MEYRELGRTGFRVSAISFGAWAIGGSWGVVDDEESMRALHAAVDHHAGSEERSMFVEAQRIGAARLRELGQALEAMLEEQRTSRFQRAFSDLKIRLLEGA